MVYMIYGKRQSSVIHIVVGAILIIYPYLFSNALLVFIAGAILTAIPYRASARTDLMSDYLPLTCPYCGEPVELAVEDTGWSRQSFVQDCPVCCQPWQVEADARCVRRLERDAADRQRVELRGRCSYGAAGDQHRLAWLCHTATYACRHRVTVTECGGTLRASRRGRQHSCRRSAVSRWPVTINPGSSPTPTAR